MPAADRQDDRSDLSRELEEANFRLNQKVVQLETLYDAGLSLSSTLRAEEVIGPFLQQVVAVLDARGGFLLLKTETTQHVVLAEHINLTPEQIRALTEDVDLRTRLRRSRSEGAPLHMGRDDFPEGFGADFVLVAPLGQIGYLGVVEKESRAGVGAFDEADAHLLQLLCQQAGASLSNARLYRKMETERNLNLSIFNSVANGVISTDLQGLVARANPAAKRIVGGRP